MDAEGERLPSRLGLTIGLTIEQTIGISLYVQPIYIAEPLQANRTGDYWAGMHHKYHAFLHSRILPGYSLPLYKLLIYIAGMQGCIAGVYACDPGMHHYPKNVGTVRQSTTSSILSSQKVQKFH